MIGATIIHRVTWPVYDSRNEVCMIRRLCSTVAIGKRIVLDHKESSIENFISSFRSVTKLPTKLQIIHQSFYSFYFRLYRFCQVPKVYETPSCSDN